MSPVGPSSMPSSTAVTPGVVGYVRSSTPREATSEPDLRAQESAILANAESRHLPVLEIHRDTAELALKADRPGLSAALDSLAAGNGTVLMVATLDRLTSSLRDATALMERAEREGWGLVALDIPIDTTTSQGATLARLLSVFAELERKGLGQRTKDALARRRGQGVKLGRPSVLPSEVVARIVAERRSGAPWAAIADRLEGDGVPTAHGGARWHANTVRKVFLANTEQEVPA